MIALAHYCPQYASIYVHEPFHVNNCEYLLDDSNANEQTSEMPRRDTNTQLFFSYDIF